MAHYFTKKLILQVRGHVADNLVYIDIPTGDLVDEEWPGRRCVVEHPQCSDARFTQTLLVCLNRGMYDSQPATKVLLKPYTGILHTHH